ncbi:hypothetical protein [Nocardia cyriacigeorgica]|uniref:hypothetical protein n=1 Tax=Nocardia cyriacigeorgica TaxID=135487 RepID=UPI001893C9AD|nr:hypothetical protein [Nocardia cyriacigeorgica]MBF6416934.1 hypothetical protein [Nocardia cyriacigeorgica]
MVNPVPAQQVTVNLAERTLLVDGRPFPWQITSDGPSIGGLGHKLRKVTITLLAHSITVIPENNDPEPTQ